MKNITTKQSFCGGTAVLRMQGNDLEVVRYYTPCTYQGDTAEEAIIDLDGSIVVMYYYKDSCRVRGHEWHARFDDKTPFTGVEASDLFSLLGRKGSVIKNFVAKAKALTIRLEAEWEEARNVQHDKKNKKEAELASYQRVASRYKGTRLYAAFRRAGLDPATAKKLGF